MASVSDLRSVAAFFRWSLNEAVRFMTDQEAPRLVLDAWHSQFVSRLVGWQLGEWKEGGSW